MFRFREVEKHFDEEKITNQKQKPAFLEIKPEKELSMKELEDFCKEEFRKVHDEAVKGSN